MSFTAFDWTAVQGARVGLGCGAHHSQITGPGVHGSSVLHICMIDTAVNDIGESSSIV